MPDVGKLELSWVLDNPTTNPTPANQKTSNGDVKMDEVVESTETGDDGDDAKVGDINGNHSNGGDNDYDVADDVDEWL